uniref:Lipocalin/cytosolic fatty-acid binding domain-containing protein n=1 Tax=Clastoptera arizonana TaxID=38151 RepID=A0A1B6DUT2_9HEMI
MFKYLLLAAVCAYARVNACETVSHIDNFKYEQFKGTWFEQQYYNSDNEGSAKCVSGTFFTNTQNNKNRVLFTNQFDKSTSLHRSIGSVNATEGGFIISFPNGQVDTYSVVNTDYKSFSVLSKCDTSSKSVSIYLMTRGRNLASYSNKYKIFVRFNETLDSIGLHRCQFQDAICHNYY